MRTVYLYGSLGQEFGHKHKFAIESPLEAIQALRANFPKFASKLRVGFYRVVVGKTEKNGMELDEGELLGFKLGKQDLHIVPVIEGAKRGGLGKIVAGIAMIGLSAMTAGATGGIFGTALFGGGMTGSAMIGSVGISMTMTGVASLLTPQEPDSAEKAKSFTSSGPTVTTREGGIVPIAYGEVITGGTMINGILTVRQENGEEKDISFADAWIGSFKNYAPRT